MQSFKCTQTDAGGIPTFSFEGQIDEEVRFPEVAAAVSHLTIDLQSVKSINSFGIREWLNWIRPLAARTKIEFVNCPKSIVLQFNTVAGFLPEGATVQSFVVPYFCESCDRERNVLFTVGVDMKKVDGSWTNQHNIVGNAECKEQPCQMSMDVTENKYFSFLKRLP